MTGAKPHEAQRRAITRTLALVLSSLMGACSVLFSGDQTQCSTNADCTARGFAESMCVANVCVAHDAGVPRLDAARDGTTGRDATSAGDAAAGDAVATGNDWTCLGHVHWPEAGPQNVLLTVPYLDLVSMLPIAGMSVQACLKLDPSCANPLTDAGFTNEAGTVTLSVPSGYDGYLLSLWDASLPALVYIDPPVFTNTVEQANDFVSSEALSILASAVGTVDGSAITLDPTKGIIFLGAYDCNGASAAGVRFAIAPVRTSEIGGYIIAGLPSLTATSTDSSGEGVIANVPPETVTITATLAATGQVIGAATGFSQADRITFLTLPPSPQ